MVRRILAAALEILEIAVVTVGAVVLVRTFLVQPFIVSGASMEPTFQSGDYILIDELSYRLRQPDRGEVAVFRYPNDESTYFIKRIIGLPGDTVVVSNGGVKIINASHPQGFVLKEAYLPLGLSTQIKSGGQSEFAIGPGQYFVLGDNRSESFDSRDWGTMKRSEIVGMARLRLWPPMEVRAFTAPSYSVSQ